MSTTVPARQLPLLSAFCALVGKKRTWWRFPTTTTVNLGGDGIPAALQAATWNIRCFGHSGKECITLDPRYLCVWLSLSEKEVLGYSPSSRTALNCPSDTPSIPTLRRYSEQHKTTCLDRILFSSATEISFPRSRDTCCTCRRCATVCKNLKIGMMLTDLTHLFEVINQFLSGRLDASRRNIFTCRGVDVAHDRRERWSAIGTRGRVDHIGACIEL